MKISVIGLGKLGLPLACILAKKGYAVTGIDNNYTVIYKLNMQHLPIQETNLWELYKKTIYKVKWTTSFDKLGEIIFIVVPTPSKENNAFTNAYVKEALDNIKGRHIVALISTVMPGTTDKLSKKYKKLSIVYNPSFIALGSVIHDFTHPNFVLMGGPKKAMDRLALFYNDFLNKPKIAMMTALEAEIAKLALNCYITTKISFANELGNICDAVGADGKVVAKAIGLDKRIGNLYFTPGLGYGGPCFPRDNLAFCRFAEDNGQKPIISTATHYVNTLQNDKIIEKIKELRPKSVGFVGLSYKPGTPHKDESQLFKLYCQLKQLGYKVRIGKGDVNIDWYGIRG